LAKRQTGAALFSRFASTFYMLINQSVAGCHRAKTEVGWRKNC